MGKRTVVLIVALILASVSAFAIYSFLTNVEEDVQAEQERVQVFRAAELIPEGTTGDQALTFVVESQELREFLPPNAIPNVGNLQSTLAGRVSAGPISQGAIITTDMWVDPVEQVDRLSTIITPGMQAISIRPDEVRAVGGFALPGDHINVLATVTLEMTDLIEFLANPLGREVLGVTEIFEPLEQLAAILEAQQPPPTGGEGEGEEPGQTDESQDLLKELVRSLPASIDITKLVMQNIEVIAVGNEARVVQDDGTVVIETIGTADLTLGDDTETPNQLGNQIMTLQVSADDAEKLVYIFEKASVYLTLVPPDYVPVETDGTTIDDLIDVFDRIIATFESQE